MLISALGQTFLGIFSFSIDRLRTLEDTGTCNVENILAICSSRKCFAVICLVSETSHNEPDLYLYTCHITSIGKETFRVMMENKCDAQLLSTLRAHIVRVKSFSRHCFGLDAYSLSVADWEQVMVSFSLPTSHSSRLCLLS